MNDRPTALEPGGTNAIGRMLRLLGDEWNLLIVQQAVLGATRFGRFAARLPISNAVLTNRLRTLVGEGLLDHRDGAYLPTPRSRSLWPLLLLIWGWERTWVPEHADRLPDMSHEACGRRFSPVLRCSCCGQPVSLGDVEISAGPSGTWERSIPTAATRRRSDSQAACPDDRQAGLFAETMAVLGNRWAAALLVAAFLGTRRFTDFQSQLGAPPSLLTERLQTFCEIGVLQSDPAGCYQLSDKGRAFFPILLMAMQWAQRWFHAPDGPAVVVTHRDCGSPLTGELACDGCGERLTGALVAVTSAAVSGIP